MKSRSIKRAIVLGAALLVDSGLAAAQLTTRASVDSNGVQADDDSSSSSLSADGRFVAFESDASNLVAGDTLGFRDIFVNDRLTGVTERASVTSTGGSANDWSEFPSISADGRFVAFDSKATNLAWGSTHCQHVYVHDRLTGVTEAVSRNSAGQFGFNSSSMPSISADGRFVAFESFAENLVPNDTNYDWDVFVRDRLTGATERVSVDSSGGEGNYTSWHPAISADGRFVAFWSGASNLVPGDRNDAYDIFLHDRQAGVTECVSIDASGLPGNSWSYQASISGDGRFVAFTSSDSNLVPNDANNSIDVFVRDRQTATTSLMSLDPNGNQVTGGFVSTRISDDGCYVAFDSSCPDLVPGDNNLALDVFLRDRVKGSTVRVSVDSNGVEGDADSGGSERGAAVRAGSISADGRFVSFNSVATNLVPSDSNGVADVFVHGPWLTLEADPPQVAAGATLTFTTWTGDASNLALLALTDIDGAPMFVPAAISAFDANGVWTLAATVPPGLTGSVLTLQTYGFVPTGKVNASNQVAVTFQ